MSRTDSYIKLANKSLIKKRKNFICFCKINIETKHIGAESILSNNKLNEYACKSVCVCRRGRSGLISNFYEIQHEFCVLVCCLTIQGIKFSTALMLMYSSFLNPFSIYALTTEKFYICVLDAKSSKGLSIFCYNTNVCALTHTPFLKKHWLKHNVA